MKNIEEEYVESYSNPEGCKAVAVALYLIVLICSIGLNILQFVKIYQLAHR